MVRLNVFILIEESARRQAIEDTAMRLVEISLKEEGCIEYDAFASISRDDVMMICETWKDKKSLDLHQGTPQFKELVGRLQELGTVTIEKFNF